MRLFYKFRIIDQLKNNYSPPLCVYTWAAGPPRLQPASLPHLRGLRHGIPPPRPSPTETEPVGLGLRFHALNRRLPHAPASSPPPPPPAPPPHASTAPHNPPPPLSATPSTCPTKTEPYGLGFRFSAPNCPLPHTLASSPPPAPSLMHLPHRTTPHHLCLPPRPCPTETEPIGLSFQFGTPNHLLSCAPASSLSPLSHLPISYIISL